MDTKVEIAGKITIRELSEPLKAKFKKALTIDNPAYFKAQGHFRVQAHFKYFKEYKDGRFVIPRGCEATVKRALPNAEYSYDLVEQDSSCLLDNKITLREYQRPLVAKMLETKTPGIVRLYTGGGKSILSLDYIASMGLTATVIVHSNATLKGFEAECKEWLGYSPGIVGGGKKEIRHITIASFATLKSDPKILKLLASKTSVLIFDECQTAISPLSQKVLSQFKPKHVFGVTATPRRSKDDGRTKAVNFMFGPVIADHDQHHLTPEIIQVEHKTTQNPFTAGIDFHDMLDKLLKNPDRNELIATHANSLIKEGKNVLILTKRVAHGELLEHMIPGLYHAKQEDKNRFNLFTLMKKGKIKTRPIVGTYAMLGTGFDLPQLDALILAAPVKSDVLTEQSCGRILRLFGDKQPVIYDIMDKGNPIFQNQAKERLKTYKSKGWIK